MAKNESNEKVVANAKQLSAGVTKHMGTATQVAFAGGPYTPAQITAKLDRVVSLRAATDAAKDAAHARVVAEQAEMPSLLAFMAALVGYAKVVYGDQPEVLADFGIRPKARAKPTAETKAAAVVKRASTREARHTMGPRQKQSVKGAVVGVTLMPVTATIATPTAPMAAAAGATASPAAPSPRGT
jgi:hypothetical protein